MQNTVKSAVTFKGLGLHTGKSVRMTVRPASADYGIWFRRTDLDLGDTLIAARWDTVVPSKLCTLVANEDGASVSTIEHIMAALAGLGINNALIEIDGPEVPIMDGSAAPFSFLLECAGIVSLNTPRKVIEILSTVRVTDGQAFAELRPFEQTTRASVPTLDLDVSIDFPDAAIGRQGMRLRLTPESFRASVASARTFARAAEIDQLRQMGLVKGGGLDNAIVVDGARVLNPGGLRMEHEFAAHKLLDAVGDLALAGAALHGRFIANRPGHALNNKLLRALFARSAAWSDMSRETETAAAA